MSGPLASIIISSYNYAAYLRQAIDSALAQTYPQVEVIVVDDGSRDGSREVIAGYGKQIRALFKANGGQASAWNAGYALCRGDVICFLDSDDALLPTAAEKALCALRASDVVKAHWRLLEIDEHGMQTGGTIPPQELPHGNLRELALQDGPEGLVFPPSSGNAWRRSFLDGVFPIPERAYPTFADSYLLALSAVSGSIARVDEPQALYRLHGKNHWLGDSFEDMLRLEVGYFDRQCMILSRFLPTDERQRAVARWTATSWCHRQQQAILELTGRCAPGDRFILVDNDEWGAPEWVCGRRRYPFLEREGQYWGAPPDDEAAIAELERQRAAGVQWLVFAWNCFWWMDVYRAFADYLNAQYPVVARNERLIIFDLRS